MSAVSTNTIPVPELASRLQFLGFSLPEQAVNGLASYLSILMQWNKAMNLVGPGDWITVLETLLADSFHLAAFLPELTLPPEPECWDLGAGAGLPGIPLRLVWQDGTYTMVESREKRTLFLQTALARCPLPRTFVARARVEAFFPTRPAADLIISRAFMPWQELLPLVSPYLADTGIVLFLTLIPAPEQLPQGWRVLAQKAYTCAGQARHFWALGRGS